MDISFQPKSQTPEEGKPLINVAEAVSVIKNLYVGEHKSLITIFLTVSIFLIVGGIFFLLSVNSSLQKEVAVKSAQLAAEDAKVVKVPMKDIKQLSDRIKIVTQVIKGQPFITTFLKALEYGVEDDVVFSKADLAAENLGGVERFSGRIEASAASYGAVLNQIQTLQTEDPYKKFFSDVKISNIGVDKKGRVSFSIVLTAVIKGVTPEVAEQELVAKGDIGTVKQEGSASSQSSIPTTAEATTTTP
jgi:hypothetical protein